MSDAPVFRVYGVRAARNDQDVGLCSLWSCGDEGLGFKEPWELGLMGLTGVGCGVVRVCKARVYHNRGLSNYPLYFGGSLLQL